MAGVVATFDFDETIIGCDSDIWVVERLGATELFDRLRPTMPLNSLMDKITRELHSQGRSIEDITNCLKTAPLDPHVVDAIRSSYALGCDLRIVSDANHLFIETILKHHGLLECFSEINTNPCYVDEDGRLRILPYHDLHSSPHGCSLCPSNMCKGKIFDRIRASAVAEGKKHFIYLGDGKGDYCPSLRLTEADYVMPRKEFPLWDLVNNTKFLKAEVHEWSNGEEFARVLLQLINKTTAADPNDSSAQLISADCKLETIPWSPKEGLLLSLKVPH
ncbi:thiamine phosphate phosphatase-like protein [Typha angustifolia]|uniref:thiamine phosphate phosphatase-like protein n=1 Tax=Typha angustifolia TaxID=59011 RepID=UPI003C2AE016